MYKGKVLTALMLVPAVAITAALAASVHLKNKPPLTFTDNTVTSPDAIGPLTLTASGALTGLGNGDVAITLSAVAQPTATCTNPGNGDHQPPGQNPALVVVGSTTGFPSGEIKNGNLAFTVVTKPPQTPVPQAPDCPNSSWTEDITDLTFVSSTITVGQPAALNADGSVSSPGPTVFTVSCGLSGQDGPLSRTCP